MSIVNAKEIMVEAVKGKYAVGAFNITDLIQLEGVVDAAVEKKSPLIIFHSSSVCHYRDAHQ